jgi:hypothetical protein
LFDDKDSKVAIIDKKDFTILGEYDVNSYIDEDSSGRFPHAFFINSKNIYVAFNNGSFECWDSVLKSSTRKN